MNAPVLMIRRVGHDAVALQVDPIDVHIGGRLRLIRRRQGVSQVELADQIGVSFQQVQKYERGTNRLSGSMMVRCCRFLKCAPNDLVEGLPGTAFEAAAESDADRAVRLLANTFEGRELLLAYDRAGERGRQLLLQVAAAFPGPAR